eukprot:SRR837773.121.p1 GENE.SRR837773.121~~SRR837773.121.p1  ORF type:complete len:219 (-),score=62.68 SRR837773.121:49-642(-)
MGPERVAQVLRENNGHAGHAAASLRDLACSEMRPVDPDDAEHVRTLLSSPAMFSHACKEQFRKFDVNGDGVLDKQEIVTLVNSLCDNFGLPPPRVGALNAFFEATDTNGDGVLSESEFKHFFECFLGYAFFDVMNQEKGRRDAPSRRDRDRDRDRQREGEPPEGRPDSNLSRRSKEPSASPTAVGARGAQARPATLR